jgi:hypothetical protein
MYKIGDLVVIVDVEAHNRWGINQRMKGMLGDIQRIVKYDARSHDIVLDQVFTWQPHHIRPATAAEILAYEKGLVKKIPIKAIKKKPLYTILKERMAGSSNVVSYALRFKRRDDSIHARDVCNARMKWPYGEKIAGDEMTEIVMDVAVAITNYFTSDKVKGRPTSTQCKAYIKYILNDSPWAGCFVTKRLSDAVQHGVKFNLDMDVSALVGAAIALREGWELKAKLILFTELTKKGYSGNAAYLTASFLQRHGTGFMQAGMNSGHSALHVSMEWVGLKKFFIEGYPATKKPIRTVKEEHYRVFDRVCEQVGVLDKDSVASLFKKAAGGIQEGAGWEMKVVYPTESHLALANWLTNELKV